MQLKKSGGGRLPMVVPGPFVEIGFVVAAEGAKGVDPVEPSGRHVHAGHDHTSKAGATALQVGIVLRTAD